MGRGLLVFKGDNPKKKKKKSKHSKSPGSSRVKEAEEEVTSAAAASSSNNSNNNNKPLPTPKVVSGTGQITSSGTVVTGQGTKFEKEIAGGDAIIVLVEGQQEMRVVTMRLSNTSLNLSSAFSQSLKNPTDFQIIRKPRDEAKQQRLRRQEQIASAREEEAKASGTSTDEFVFREKTEHGSYRIKREKVQGSGISRADLLDMRAKKTSDKYC